MSDSSFNDSNYESEEYDRLIADARSEAERMLLEDAAAIAPAYYAETASLIKPYVQNYEAHPLDPSTDYKYVEIGR